VVFSPQRRGEKEKRRGDVRQVLAIVFSYDSKLREGEFKAIVFFVVKSFNKQSPKEKKKKYLVMEPSSMLNTSKPVSSSLPLLTSYRPAKSNQSSNPPISSALLLFSAALR
jgi:hypothetical protein